MNARRDASENLETARAAMTTADPRPAAEAKKKGSRSAGVLAGQLFTRLCALDTEEVAELAASPADIRARYEAKRSKALAEASEEVRGLVERMRS